MGGVRQPSWGPFSIRLLEITPVQLPLVCRSVAPVLVQQQPFLAGCAQGFHRGACFSSPEMSQ